MSLTEKDLKSLLALNRLSEGGLPLYMEELLHGGMLPSELVHKILEENLFDQKEQLEKTLCGFSANEEIEKCEQWGIRLLTFWDEDYPPSLRNISNPPAVLYIAGNLIPEDSAALAVVGSRHPSIYGILHTRRFASELAAAGITIVSGMAQGIDLAAHEGALEIPHGRTIAILGCGLDVDYPRHRKKLQEKFLERGAVISEYPFGTPPLPGNFPKRNRIIAGLALGVFVAEAHEISGSLITARQALEQGKDVFALPGPVDRLTSRGAHRLIKEGACLVENPQDILISLKMPLQEFVPASAPDPEIISPDEEDSGPLPEAGETAGLQAEILVLLKEKGLCLDELAAVLEKPPEHFMPAVTLLELKRSIHKNPDGKYIIKSKKA